jgi:hypothetical protein
MPIHRRIEGNSVHTPYFRIYADSTTRLADTGFTSDQVNKLALQKDDNTEWTLDNHSPITWSPIIGAPASGNLQTKRYPLVFDSSGSFNIGDPLPTGSRVNGVVVDVTQAFDGVTESTITIGDAGDPDRFCETTEVDLTVLEKYSISNYYNYTSETQVTGTYVQDSATQGAAYIEVFYSIP